MGIEVWEMEFKDPPPRWQEWGEGLRGGLRQKASFPNWMKTAKIRMVERRVLGYHQPHLLIKELSPWHTENKQGYCPYDTERRNNLVKSIRQWQKNSS